jgi:hypothetical protein
MLPSLLDMVRENLKLTVPLPPDLIKTLEKNGETMVHEYYGMKADKVIEHNRNNPGRDRQQDKNTLDMSRACNVIDKKLAEAEALVQERMGQQSEQQGPASEAEQLHPRTSHQDTQLARHTRDTQAPHTGLQHSSGSDSGLPERISPITDGADHDDMRSRGPSRLRHAMVESITDRETSSTEYCIGTDPNESVLESALNSDDVTLDSMTSEETESSVTATSESAWSDEWARSEEPERAMATNTSAWSDEWTIRDQEI